VRGIRAMNIPSNVEPALYFIAATRVI